MTTQNKQSPEGQFISDEILRRNQAVNRNLLADYENLQKGITSALEDFKSAGIESDEGFSLAAPFSQAASIYQPTVSLTQKLFTPDTSDLKELPTGSTEKGS